jgi:hypothetical protein
MEANQRSTLNNQTSNVANEKDHPGARGSTGSGPLDHTYPLGAGPQQAIRGEQELAGSEPPSSLGRQPVTAEDGSRPGPETGLAHPVESDLPGGSLQSQQTGGTGPQQGITDSHQRQMELHSDAWGLLEQPVGRRDPNSGTDVHVQPGNEQHTRASHAQDPADNNGQGTGMAIGPHSSQENV